MSEIQRYPFAMAANGVFILPCTGTRFLISSSLGAVNVRLDIGGRLANIQAGEGYKGRQFQGLEISDASGAVNTGWILVADDDYTNNRVVGEVSVIDGGKARTLSNRALSYWTQKGQIAAEYSAVQLWNPAGSGANLIIEKITIASLINTGFSHAQHNVALAAVLGTPMSKLLGAVSASVCQPRAASAAAMAGQAFAISNGAASNSIIFQPPEPIVVPPGWGHIVWGQALNADISATWDWFEEPA
jgi:hypothetical protein